MQRSKESMQVTEGKDLTLSPKCINQMSLSDLGLSHRIGNTQDSLSCSVILGSRPAHSRQCSQFSDYSAESYFGDLGDAPELAQSPMKLMESLESREDKENLGEAMRSYHRRQPSVIIKSGVEQSYSHMLSGLGSQPSSVVSSPSKTFYPVEKPRKSLYSQTKKVLPESVGDIHQKQGVRDSSMDILSDCSSILESGSHGTIKTIPDSSMTEPNSEIAKAESEERVSTIYTNLSSDSSRAPPTHSFEQSDQMFYTPATKERNRGSLTSPFAGTTNHTDSNHFEIDLFDSASPDFNLEQAVRFLAEHPEATVEEFILAMKDKYIEVVKTRTDREVKLIMEEFRNCVAKVVMEDRGNRSRE